MTAAQARRVAEAEIRDYFGGEAETVLVDATLVGSVNDIPALGDMLDEAGSVEDLGMEDLEVQGLSVRIEPTPPPCTRPRHRWEDEHVVGHGGGVLITDQCRWCGWRRQLDTWGQVRGQQGITLHRFVPPPRESYR